MAKFIFGHSLKQFSQRIFIVICLSAITMGLAFPRVQKVHADDGISIMIDGVIQSINGNVWVVGDVTVLVDTSSIITGTPTVGSHVHIVAIQLDDGKLQVKTVVIVDVTLVTPTSTGTSTPSATTPTSTATLVASPTAGSPTATSVMGTPAATADGVTFTIIIIDGPVEEVHLDINIIVVYGHRIKIDKDDPVRLKIKIGDWVHIKGHFDHDSDGQIVIIVIVIVIVDTPPSITIVPPAPSNNGGKGNGDDEDDNDQGHKHGNGDH
jgi:hypothetical protein